VVTACSAAVGPADCYGVRPERLKLSVDPTENLPNVLNLEFLESLYADFRRDPSAVPPEWRRYFERLLREDPALARARPGPSFRPSSLFNPPGRDGNGARAALRPAEIADLQDRVDQLIRAYRVRGHRIARVDPLGAPRPPPLELELGFYGLREADKERIFSSETIPGDGHLTLGEILERLQNTYCRSIGVQYMHIDSLQVRSWLRERMESTQNRLDLSRKEQLRILTRLTDAVIFEEFLQKKYLGSKTFSLEGAESLIPLLDLAIEKAGEQGIDEIVLAMAHRGRINVLANILGKSAREIFREFEDTDPELHLGRGDVKYHLGHSNDWMTAAGRKVHISLCFNPSHLEYVNPVALGRMRAKQDRAGDLERARGMVLLIHGDAAFAGEGIVQETLNLGQLEAYTVGGAIHVVVNNQIGFTTSPAEASSTTYATDVAKMLQSPIFHVNGEDPEAVAQVVKLAMDFRLTFRRDVVIDMFCYRRRGHNEGDEPSFTHPLLYRAIAQRKSVREGYLDHLLELGGMTREEADRIAEERLAELERGLAEARSEDYAPRSPHFTGIWKGFRGGAESDIEEEETDVDEARLRHLLEVQTRVPEGFHVHPKLARGMEARLEMARGERALDWSAAEALAFATLATAGHRVRLSGQDSARGTFSQRHAILHDYEDGRTYAPLQHLAPDQAPVEMFNSPLSEAGVLGFEYGYSLDCPEGLVLWEAQFGDFVNAAQVIIDQFIASAEDKWRRLSGLVLLLPHGFEGMGPEHSSARLERFLTLAADDNIRVVNLTTPAQYFHCLRRQVLVKSRKPLVIMTPKSLLRHPRAVSSLEELARGGFQRLIPDRTTRSGDVKRVILCSGKFYYDLERKREELGREDAAIIRLEQLYPLPREELGAELERYAAGTAVVWAQEEPDNMGAWRYLRLRLRERLSGRFPFSGVRRPASASPATGSTSSHKLEQEELLERAFGAD
jgi:2-oxoglutarate dehydrogenase E1 component